MMRKTLILGLAATAVLTLTLTRSANAAFKIRLSDGITTKTVTDDVMGPSGDFAPDDPGFIIFLGGVGNFNINIATGKSKPFLGSASSPIFGIDINANSRSGGGTLTIEITDTGFGPSLNPLPFLMGMDTPDAASGSVSYQAWVDLTNAEFGTGQLIAAIGPTTAGTAFDLSALGSVPTDGAYSVTAKFTIVHSAAANQSTDFDAHLTAVPEPASLGMWGLIGLVCAGGAMYRRSRKQVA
jgi:hypothetical protein